VLCSRPLRVVRLNGSCKAHFHNRLTRVQLAALCEALADDTDVEYLDLCYNDATPAAKHGDPEAATFGDEGASIVARLLKTNSSIRCLLLEGNAIGDDGTKELAQALARGAGGLEVLNLASNAIGDDVRWRLLACVAV
jgi:hypothetical protein